MGERGRGMETRGGGARLDARHSRSDATRRRACAMKASASAARRAAGAWDEGGAEAERLERLPPLPPPLPPPPAPNGPAGEAEEAEEAEDEGEAVSARGSSNRAGEVGRGAWVGRDACGKAKGACAKSDHRHVLRRCPTLESWSVLWKTRAVREPLFEL